MNLNIEKIKIMRDEKIPAALLKLGIPTMIGMLIAALYNTADAYFVGRLGTSQMAAVSVTFPIGQFIIGFAMTFGTGAASYISRLLGAQNKKNADKTASTSLYASLFISLFIIAFILFFLDEILIFLGATTTILPYAREYAIIYTFGSILSIFNVVMNNIVTSEGAAKLTMLSMLTGAFLNIILDPIFIYVFECGIKGAAIATVLSQFITSLIYLHYILFKKGFLTFSIKNFSFNKKIYLEIFKIGIPTFVFQILTSVSIGLTNTAASVYGDSAVAAMGITTRIMAMGTFVIFGYMKGFQPVAGYNYGAKNYKRLKESVKVSLKWSTLFCVITAVLLMLFSNEIISCFSKNDSAVIEIGSKTLRINSMVFIFFGFQMIIMSLFLAIGRGKEGGILSISRNGIFFIPVILMLPQIIGLNGVIYAQTIADIFTLLLTVFFTLRIKNKLKDI